MKYNIFENEHYDIKVYNVCSTNIQVFDKSDIPVVTGFIDLGDFMKGGDLTGKNLSYYEWVDRFSKIKNHVICFTDDAYFYKKFQLVRAGLPTTLLTVNKTELLSYGKVPAIQRIFDQDTYSPDTKNAPFVAAMNSKYDFVAKAINLFPRVDHAMWLDVSLFRTYPKDAPCFYLRAPPNFVNSTIAYNEVFDFRPNLPARTIVYDHLVWISGGAFYCTREARVKFIDQLRSAVDGLISMEMLSSDQQTLYSIYSDPMLTDLRKISVQTYRLNTSVSNYFFLQSFNDYNVICHLHVTWEVCNIVLKDQTI